MRFSLHIQQNNSHEAKAWLEKALKARWDDRPTLSGRSLFTSESKPHFKRFAQSTDFKALLNNDVDSTMTREAKWRFDLRFLISEIERLHVAMYQNMTKQQFDKKVEEIYAAIPSLSDEQIVYQFMELIGLLGNGHNSSGNGSLTPLLVATAAFFSVLKPQGKLFILIGRNTFSAGHDVAVKITNIVPAILAGEPSGTRPNVVGEAGWFNLPYSKQTGLISSQFHQQSRAEDHRVWLSPDIPISLGSKEYFLGKDPVMNTVLKLTKNSD